MDIRISKENALKVLEILGEVTEVLETVLEDHWVDEGVEGTNRTMEEVLQNPVARAIWRIGDVFEILEDPMAQPVLPLEIPA